MLKHILLQHDFKYLRLFSILCVYHNMFNQYSFASYLDDMQLLLFQMMLL